MAVPNIPLVVKMLSVFYRVVYRLIGGAVCGTAAGMPVLLLTTRGRRTAKRRTRPLQYLKEDEAYVVVASYAGNRRHPGWWLNLRHQSDAEVQVGRRRLPVIAEQASPEERRRLWPLLVQRYPAYDVYRRRTDREIPVMFLRPRRTAPG